MRTSLGIASHGLLDRGALSALHISTQGMIRLGGLLAPPVPTLGGAGVGSPVKRRVRVIKVRKEAESIKRASQPQSLGLADISAVIRDAEREDALQRRIVALMGEIERLGVDTAPLDDLEPDAVIDAAIALADSDIARPQAYDRLRLLLLLDNA